MNDEKLIIEMCKEEDLNKAINLSEECKMIYANGKVERLGISRPIKQYHFGKIVVAKIKNEVVGALVVKSLDDGDRIWYGLNNDNGEIIIEKICVNKNFRGLAIAGKMINFVKQNNLGKAIYIDIMSSPKNNKASKKAFEKESFVYVKEAPYYFEKLNLNTVWSIYKFVPKKNNS